MTLVGHERGAYKPRTFVWEIGGSPLRSGRVELMVDTGVLVCFIYNWDRALLVALDPFIDRHVAPGFPNWTELFREMVCERIELQREEDIASTPACSPQSHSSSRALA